MNITNKNEGRASKCKASRLGWFIALGVGVGGAISFGTGDQSWIALGAPLGVALDGIVTLRRLP